jgi:hypothetical protein
MTRARPATSAALAVMVVLGIALEASRARAQDRRGTEITAERVRDAIDRAVDFLKKSQTDGRWPEFAFTPNGVTCLCTLALLSAGVPLDDPAMQAAMKQVRAMNLDTTYGVSLQTMVLCAAEPAKDAQLISRNVRWLESRQHKDGPLKGAWDYSLGL